MSKRISAIILFIAMMFTIAVPAFASNSATVTANMPDKKSADVIITIKDGADTFTNKDYNNAQFHCSTFGGNCRVWLTMGKDNSQKYNKAMTFIKESKT